MEELDGMIACSSSVGVGEFIYGTNNKNLSIQLKELITLENPTSFTEHKAEQLGEEYFVSRKHLSRRQIKVHCSSELFFV